MLVLYVYSLETDELMGIIEGENNKDCEAKAECAFGSNDYWWSYTEK